MDIVHATAPFVGGIALEVIYWAQIKEQLSQVKYRKLLASRSYWTVTVATVLVGGVVALYWAVSKSELPTPFELLVAGAAAPSLLKNAIIAFSARKHTDLGEADDVKVGVRDYFIPAG